MWHLYKNSQGKWEVCFFLKGRYIVGSKQGYVRRKTALNAVVQSCNIVSGFAYIQDNTTNIVLEVYVLYRQVINIKASNLKPVKPYRKQHKHIRKKSN